MADKCKPQSAGMVACRLSPAAVDQLLAEKPHDFEDITISCFNSPNDSVLAGPPVSLAKLVQHCKAKGIRHKRLDVLYGFHSHAMEPILHDLGQCGRSIAFSPPCLRVGSSLRGRLLWESETIDAEYFVQHAREPVNFSGAVEDTLRWLTGCHPTFIEIGPSPSSEAALLPFSRLQAPVRESCRASPHFLPGDVL